MEAMGGEVALSVPWPPPRAQVWCGDLVDKVLGKGHRSQGKRLVRESREGPRL